MPWTSQLVNLPERYNPSVKHASDQFRGVFKSSLYDPNFEPAEEKRILHNVPSTVEGVYDHILSWSAIAPLGANEKEKVKDAIGKILQKGEGLEWIDKDKGLLEFPHDCLAVIIKRKGAPATLQEQ